MRALRIGIIITGIVIVSLSMFSGCRSSGIESIHPMNWIPFYDREPTAETVKLTTAELAQRKAVERIAGAGTLMIVGGAIMLAIPGARGWGGSVLLTGAGLLAGAIAFGHHWVPLLSFVILLVFAGWKIHSRIIKTNIENE